MASRKWQPGGCYDDDDDGDDDDVAEIRDSGYDDDDGDDNDDVGVRTQDPAAGGGGGTGEETVGEEEIEEDEPGFYERLHARFAPSRRIRDRSALPNLPGLDSLPISMCPTSENQSLTGDHQWLTQV